MTDIAAAVGLSPSSIYNHFGTKGEILLDALNRGDGYLQITLDDALREADGEAAALRRLVAVYSAFAVRHSGSWTRSARSCAASAPRPNR
jgi:AcrR family transcriptional regulator